jgi:hypothetical protein
LPLVAALALTGCDGDTERMAPRGPEAPAVSDPVARVGQGVIGASQVAERMVQDGSTREAALQALVDEELLVQEARERRIDREAEIERATERVMVRAMLRDFEASLTPELVPVEEVRADFEEHEESYQVLERRRSWQVLVKDPTPAGRAEAESILKSLRRAKEPRAVFDRFARGENTPTDVEVVAEELPPITRKARVEQAFKDALFAANATGPLREPVETSYGWHVVYLEEIIPGKTRTLEDVEDEIRQRLSQKQRFEKLVKTVHGLEAEKLVRYDDEGVERLMSMAGLPEHAAQ